MRVKTLSVLALGLLLLALPVQAAEIACSVPPELMRDDPTLPRTAKRLKARQPLTIVALGGGSTLGAMGDIPHSYPAQLETVLRKRYPGAEIKVLNKGIQRQTAQQMVERIKRDVLANEATLVIWEPGTTEAARGLDAEQFAATLQTGIDMLKDAGVELMLMDMQYGPNTVSVINFQPYLDNLHKVADLNEVYKLKRYEIMRHWSDNGTFDFRTVAKSRGNAGMELAGEVYHCLAERVADAIGYATE